MDFFGPSKESLPRSQVNDALSDHNVLATSGQNMDFVRAAMMVRRQGTTICANKPRPSYKPNGF